MDPLAEVRLENRVREKRQRAGLSQAQLARYTGITRQAVSAIEAGQYSPATPVALRLAAALGCRVEDLFQLQQSGTLLEAELIGELPARAPRLRAKIVRVAGRVLARPLVACANLSDLSAAADGFIVGPGSHDRTVRVELCKASQSVYRQIAVAGCDPAIALVAEYFGREGHGALDHWTSGSAAAIEALNRGEVHAAGVHLVDPDSGENNLPYLRRHLLGTDYLVVTFAAWQEGFLVAPSNPKGIRSSADLARAGVKFINREPGSGARYLVDQQMAACAVRPDQVCGYGDIVRSHLEVAWMVKSGLADVGVGLETAAVSFGLDFVPLQRERYDLVIPKPYYGGHRELQALLETIVSGPFRAELDALGGYDTSETGKVWDLKSVSAGPTSS